jgi:hypothetical protein
LWPVGRIMQRQPHLLCLAASPPSKGGEKAHALAVTPSPFEGEGWGEVLF